MPLFCSHHYVWLVYRNCFWSDFLMGDELGSELKSIVSLSLQDCHRAGSSVTPQILSVTNVACDNLNVTFGIIMLAAMNNGRG